MLQDDVVCSSLATGAHVFARELETAGFVDVVVTDKTADWAAYTRARASTMAAESDKRLQLGGALFDSLLQFYELVANLFEGGNLGGLEVYARRL